MKGVETYAKLGREDKKESILLKEAKLHNANARLLIDSWTGNGNIGDEAILYSVTQLIKSILPAATIFALTDNPTSTSYFNPDVIPVLRPPLKKVVRWIKLLDNVDGFFIAGGQMLHAKSVRRFCCSVLLARMLGVKTFANSLGVSSIESVCGKLFFDAFAKGTCSFTVRDALSQHNVVVNRGPFRSVKAGFLPDPAVSLTPEDRASDCERVFKQYGIEKVLRNSGGPLLGLLLRIYGDDTDYYQYIIRNIATFLKKKIESDGARVILFPLMRGRFQDDLQICAQVAREVNNHNSLVVVDQQPTIPDLLCLFSQLDLLIGARLHSLILAISQHVPIIALGHYWKIEQMMQLIHLRHLYLADDNLEALNKMYEAVMEKRNGLAEYLARLCADLRASLVAEYHRQLQFLGFCP